MSRTDVRKARGVVDDGKAAARDARDVPEDLEVQEALHGCPGAGSTGLPGERRPMG